MVINHYYTINIATLRVSLINEHRLSRKLKTLFQHTESFKMLTLEQTLCGAGQ